MGVNYNPKIVTDGLVLALDAANPKSYPGSGTTIFDLSEKKYNGTSTTLSVADLTGVGKVLNFNTSSIITSTFSTPVNHESWSLIYWIRSTGLTTSNYRGVIQLIEPNASHGYFYNIDTREIANSYILGYQKHFSINDWLTYGYMNAAQLAAQEWWCLGVSHNNKIFKHYNNGVLVNTQTQTRDVEGYDDLTSMRLNYYGSNTVYMGPIQFYEGVLTDNQFQQNFNATRSRFGI